MNTDLRADAIQDGRIGPAHFGRPDDMPPGYYSARPPEQAQEPDPPAKRKQRRPSAGLEAAMYRREMEEVRDAD